MRGHILGVDTRTGDGLVAGDDGTRYAFRPADWAHVGEPAIGLYVDFEVDSTHARSLFPVPGASLRNPPAAPTAVRPNSDRNKYVAAVLAFLFGTLGIHRFYLGRTRSGITMLLLTCTLVGLIVTGPWAFIDMVRYLLMSDRDFANRYARTSR